MMTELHRAEMVVRDALNDLAGLEPDEIAEKLRDEGMLWCNPRGRAISCPIHHWLEARLEAQGLDHFVVNVAVTAPYVTLPTRSDRSIVWNPQPVAEFIRRYDRGHYEHLEVTR